MLNRSLPAIYAPKLMFLASADCVHGGDYKSGISGLSSHTDEKNQRDFGKVRAMKLAIYDEECEARWERISEAMDRAGITSQRQLAIKLGISNVSVNGWANCKFMPTMEHMLKIAAWGRVCVEWLWTGRGPKTPLDKNLAELLDELEALPPERREEILRFARFRRSD